MANTSCCAAADFLLQFPRLGLQAFLPFGAQRGGGFTGIIEQAQSFGIGCCRRLLEQVRAFLVESGVLVQYAGCLHVAIQFFALTAALADAAEDADPLVLADHVVDHLGQQHGLADTGTAEQTRLAATFQRHQHIDELDAGREDFGLGRAPGQRRRRSMHAAPFDGGCRQAVDGRAEHIEHPRQDFPSDRRQQGPATINDTHATGQPLGERQGDAAYPLCIKLGQDFNGHFAIVPGMQQGMNRRQQGLEANIDNAATDRRDVAGIRLSIPCGTRCHDNADRAGYVRYA